MQRKSLRYVYQMKCEKRRDHLLVHLRRLARMSRVYKWALKRAYMSQWGGEEDAVVLVYRPLRSSVRLMVMQPGHLFFSPLDASRVLFGDDRLQRFWEKYPGCLSCTWGECAAVRIPKVASDLHSLNDLMKEALEFREPLFCYHSLRAPSDIPPEMCNAGGGL